MDIHKTKAFAQAYEEVGRYFINIAPKKILQPSIFPEVTGAYTSLVDIKFDSANRNVPYQSSEFLRLYNTFMDELKGLVLKHEKNTVLSLLEVYFTQKEYPHIELSKVDVFSSGREDLIDLLEVFELSRSFINNLVNDYDNVNAYGIIGYYDSFKAQAAMEKEQPQEEAKEANPEQKNNQRSDISNALPGGLDTDEAKALFQIAIKAGLLNSDYTPTNKTETKAQKALLADIIGEKIGLQNKWKPFETLWHVSGLAQQRYDSREKVGKVRGGDIIEAAFS